MPATTLRLQDTVTGTNFRQWVASSVQDVAAGNGLAVQIDLTTGGAAPPNAPTTLELKVQDDTGTVIRTFALTPGLATQTVVFNFSSDGTAVGSPRCGTVELNLHAQRGGAGSYDVESDGNPNSPPAGFTRVATRGWARGTTTLTESISNVALGGAVVAPIAYDDSLFVRLVNGAQSYVARALTVTVLGTTVPDSLSAATTSTTATTRDVTFANVADDRFPSALTNIGVSAVVPNAALSGQPDWAYSATVEATANLDPRLTVTWHMQLNDPVFGTAKPVVTELSGPSDLGHTWARTTNARGTGVNGLSASVRFTDPFGVNTIGFARTTVTLDGQAGWTNTVATFSESKPSGSWTLELDVTAPLDIEQPEYLVGSPSSFTVLSPNPDYKIFGALGPVQSASSDTWAPGDPMLIGATMFDTKTGNPVVPNVGTGVAPSVSIGRFSATGQVEYLRSDLTGWDVLPADGSGSVAKIQLIRADLLIPGANTRVYLLVINDTTSFNTTTIFGLFYFSDQLGNRYSSHVPMDPVEHQFDPTGLFS